MMVAGFIRVLRIIFLILIVVFFCPFAHGKIIYVDDDAVGTNDGSSWQNAYTFLQNALVDANSAEKPIEIRVAQGIYKPDIGANQMAGDREATFQLISGVTLKGGYAGLGEPDPNAREVASYETVLSGDLVGNDAEVADPCNLPNEPTRSENSCQVVTGSDTDKTAVLDSFTITAGNADGLNQQYEGGGMYNSSGNPTLIDCTFSGNSALRGGGVHNWENSNPTLTNCTFFGNQAQSGGAIENNFTSSPMLTNCSFTNNSAESGGGMYNANSSNPKLVDCTFSRNRAKLGGGMINNWSSPTLTNCTFNDNSTYQYWGGGMMNWECTAPILTDCTFSRNSGLGLYNKNSSPVLKNCIFSENYGGMYNEYSNLTLTNCAFSGNSLGGIRNLDSSLTLNNCTFTANSAGNGGGISSASEGYGETKLTLTNCTFTSNLTVGEIGRGGGMYCSTRSRGKAELTMTNCMFTGNQALGEHGHGGGMYSSIENPILTNCIFSGNLSSYGGAIYNEYDSSANLTNCIFSGNLSSYGGAIYNEYDSSANLINCILWGNIADYGSQVCLYGTTSSLAVEYSDLQGGRTAITNLFADDEITWGPGNIDVDPGFVLAGYWTQPTPRQPGEPVWIEGDYHLKSQADRWDPNSQSWVQDDVTSPCIDAGDPNSPVGYEPFPNGGIINMGAYGGTAEASKSPSGLHAKYGSGTGEPNDPYLIYTAEHLNAIGAEPNDWDKHFKLMANIDLSAYTGTDFNIIGTDDDNPFTGVFDGNGYTISNFSYDCNGVSHIGLFGNVGYPDRTGNPQIMDLGLIDPTIDAGTGRYIGSLVGHLRDGNITGCYAEGGRVSGSSNVGGIVGRIWWGTIINCHSLANVTGRSDIAGLVGYNYGGTVANCFTDGNVTGDRCVGGLVAWNNFLGEIVNCYVAGDITGDEYVGGLVGRNHLRKTRPGTIRNCYSVGQVTGIAYVGGLVGLNWGTVEFSFWDIQTSGQTTSDGGVGKTTAEMQATSTFLDAGWDFMDETENGTEDIWWILEGQDYPQLWRELTENN